jgi:hypothetical protein
LHPKRFARIGKVLSPLPEKGFFMLYNWLCYSAKYP